MTIAAKIAASFETPPEHSPTFSLEKQVREARREMGEARWAQLQAEWDAPAPVSGGGK